MTNNHPERIKLESGLARMGLDVTSEAVDGLLVYMDLLKEWSGTYNLRVSNARSRKSRTCWPDAREPEQR